MPPGLHWLSSQNASPPWAASCGPPGVGAGAWKPQRAGRAPHSPVSLLFREGDPWRPIPCHLFCFHVTGMLPILPSPALNRTVALCLSGFWLPHHPHPPPLPPMLVLCLGESQAGAWGVTQRPLFPKYEMREEDLESKSLRLHLVPSSLKNVVQQAEECEEKAAGSLTPCSSFHSALSNLRSL